MMKSIFLAAVFLICGCRTPYQPTEFAPTANTRRVMIETDPPGMRIFFGIAGTDDRSKRQREYVGISPCTATVECDEEGRFVNHVSSFARPVAIFYADAPTAETNLFNQEQSFVVPAIFIRPPPIPRAIFFDMKRGN